MHARDRGQLGRSMPTKTARRCEQTDRLDVVARLVLFVIKEGAVHPEASHLMREAISMHSAKALSE